MSPWLSCTHGIDAIRGSLDTHGMHIVRDFLDIHGSSQKEKNDMMRPQWDSLVSYVIFNSLFI